MQIFCEKISYLEPKWVNWVEKEINFILGLIKIKYFFIWERDSLLKLFLS